MTNLKDILSTIAAVVVFLVGTYTQYVDSLPAGASFNWKAYLMFLAIALGLYLQGKSANGKTKTAAQVEAQKDPGTPTVKAAFPTAIKVLVVILLLPVLIGVSGCAGTTGDAIFSSACTIANQICMVQSKLCAIVPYGGLSMKATDPGKRAADSLGVIAQQKYWMDSLNVLSKQLQSVTK